MPIWDVSGTPQLRNERRSVVADLDFPDITFGDVNEPLA
jgi:hypothetical protein